MKGLKKQRRIQLILVAFVSMAVAVALIGYALRDGINLFRSPSQVIAEPPSADEVFKLGGLVKEGTLVRGDGFLMEFVVTDGGAEIAVSYIGDEPAPDLFKEGQGTITTGTFDGTVFEATEILAKHDENYTPKEVIDALKEQGVYQDPNG